MWIIKEEELKNTNLQETSIVFKMKLLLKKGINNSIEIQAVKFIITQGQVCESVSDRLTVCACMHVVVFLIFNILMYKKSLSLLYLKWNKHLKMTKSKLVTKKLYWKILSLKKAQFSYTKKWQSPNRYKKVIVKIF